MVLVCVLCWGGGGEPPLGSNCQSSQERFTVEDMASCTALWVRKASVSPALEVSQFEPPWSPKVVRGETVGQGIPSLLDLAVTFGTSEMVW